MGDEDNVTALVQFVEKLDIVKFLLSCGADLNKASTDYKITPLHELILKKWGFNKFRASEIAKLLVMHGGDLNALEKNFHAHPPLILLVDSNQLSYECLLVCRDILQIFISASKARIKMNMVNPARTNYLALLPADIRRLMITQKMVAKSVPPMDPSIQDTENRTVLSVAQESLSKMTDEARKNVMKQMISMLEAYAQEYEELMPSSRICEN